MQTVAITTQPVINASVLTGAFRSQALRLAQESVVEFEAPRFAYSFTAPLVETITEAESQRTRLKIALDDSVWLIVNLQQGAEDVGVSFEPRTISAQTEFIAATFQALLSLSGAVNLRAPALQLDAQLTFAEALEEVSPLLQRRQIAYRALFIEAVLQQSFAWPLTITKAEADRVAFVYRALTEQSFIWPFFQGEYPYWANEEALKLLDNPGQPNDCKLHDANYSAAVFGHQLSLGRAVITVEKAVLVNVEEVQRELATPAGHEFRLLIQSLAGLATYEFPAARQLPTPHWNERLAEFRDLENKLDEAYFEAVNRLAADCLPDFPAEEIPPPFPPEAISWSTNEEGV